MSSWEVLLSLRAQQTGEPQPQVGCQRYFLLEHTQLLATLSMPRRDPSLHAYALCSVASLRGATWVCPDTDRDALHDDTLKRLSNELKGYWQQCQQAESFPQLLVPSRNGVEQLRALYHLVDGRVYRGENSELPDPAPELVRLRNMLGWYARMVNVPGQPVLLSLSGLLGQHYAFGAGEPATLSAQLAWFQAGDQHPALRALQAEHPEQGLDPQTDQALAEALLREGKRLDAPSPGLRMRTEQALADPVKQHMPRILALAGHGLEALSSQPFAPHPRQERLQAVARKSFERAWEAWEETDYRFPARMPRGASRLLQLRESWAEADRLTWLWEDPVTRARGRHLGEVLHGELLRQGQQWQLRSQQEQASCRAGDDLVADLPQGRLPLRVLGVERQGAELQIQLQGNEAEVGPDPVDLLPEPRSYGGLP